MPIRIVLAQTVRLFENRFENRRGSLLFRTGEVLSAGSVIYLVNIQIRSYDHMDMLVIAVGAPLGTGALCFG